MPLAITESADLSALNAFGIAARARQLITLTDEADAPEAIDQLRSAPRSLLLGAGSNLLFTGDVDGTVLKVSLTGRKVADAAIAGVGLDDATVLVEAAAGEPWHDFVLWTLAQGLSGLENLALIPGSVGAAPVQNIGAYGVELREHLHSVRALSLEDGRSCEFAAAECGFGYRDSRFRSRTGRAQWLILSVRFALSRYPRPTLHYPDLQTAFPPTAPPPSPLAIARAVCAIRERKLPNPAELGNAGSFFRNPVVDATHADRLAANHPGLPVYRDPATPHQAKLPAGWLIEQCGWKGARRGDAGVHTQHALVLVNYGRARGADIAALAADIQASVFERFGVRLEPEVVFV